MTRGGAMSYHHWPREWTARAAAFVFIATVVWILR